MKEKIEETYDNKSESTKSSKLIVVINRCKDDIVEQKDDPNTTASQLLDTVIEMFKHVQITPESEQNEILRSNPKDNYLFSDKLKQSCNGAPAEIAKSEREKCITSNGEEAENGAIVNSQNGFLENQKAKDSLKSALSVSHVLETSNGQCLLGSTRKIVKESVLSKVLEDRKQISSTGNIVSPDIFHKQISSTGNIMSPDIFHFTAPPRLYSKPKFSKFRTSIPTQTMSLIRPVKQTGTSADSTLGIGGLNVQASLTSSVSKMVSQSPIVTFSKSENSTVAQSLTCQASIQNVSQNQAQSTTGTPIQLAKGGAVATSVYSSGISPILNTPAVSSEVNKTKPSFNSTLPNVIDVEGKITPTIESKATTIMSPTRENKGNVFNKAALMSMFDGSRNLFGTTTVQNPMSTDTKPQASFPFRNKYAASSELSSRRCSQKKLQEMTRIANPKFKMSIPTFCQAFRNVSSIYVFGGQEAITSMFDQMSKSQNVFKTPPATKTNTLNMSGNSTLLFTIGASPSVYSGKSPAQQNMTRPTNRLQNYKVNLYKYQDYKRALDMFEEAIKLCPDNYTFYFIRAQYYMKLGMYTKAVKDVQKVIEYDSSFIDGYIGLAKCCIALGDISAADDAVCKARKAGGDAEGERASEALRELRARYAKTQRAIAAGDYALAVTSADSFLELCPSNYAKATKAKCLAMLGRTEQAMEIAEECLRNYDAEPEALYAKGLCLYYSCKLHQAVDYFQQVISVFPLHLGAIDSLQKANRLECLAKESKIASNQGDYQKVIALNNEAMTVDKMNKEYNVKLYCNNAVMYSKLNETHSAVKSCSDALRLNDKSVVVLRNRAKCFSRLGQYEDAVRDYEKVYQIDKSVENEVLLNEAKALAQEKENAYREMASSVESLVRDKKFLEALKLADECLQIRSSDTDVLYSKGLSFYYMCQFEEAMKLFKKIFNSGPTIKREVFLQLQKTKSIKNTIKQGDDLFTSGRWIEARSKYKQAKDIDGANSNLSVRMHCKMAETCLKLNKKHLAIEEYMCALRFDNRSLEVLRERAKCYTELENYEDAIKDYTEIYTIAECEETKTWALNFIKTLQEKDYYRKKIMLANSLMTADQFKNADDALKLVEECLQFDSSDIQTLCVKGSCLYYKDQYQEALDQYKQILLLEPSHSTALKESQKIARLISKMEKGDSAFISQRWQDALDYFNEAVTIDEYNRNLKLRLYFKKAIIYVILNDKQSAIKEYTNALAVDSNCSNALLYRAQCYSDVKQYEQAIEDYEKLYTVYKDEEVSEKLLVRNSIERLKDKIAYREKLKQADTLLASRTTESLKLAVKIAEECLKFDSTDTKALCVKGLCLYYKDQYEQALDQFRQVLLLEPSHAMAFKETKKITKLKRTIDKGNDSFRRGRLQDALDNFNEALTIDGENKKLNVRLHCKKATTLKLISERNIHAAIREYTMALLLDTNCVEALRGRAQCYSQVKQYEDAVKDYEKLCTVDQSEEIKQLLDKAKMAHKEQKYRFAQEKAEIGHKHFKRKKFRDALSMYKEAIRLDPETAEYYSNTYSCYIHLSMLKEALIDAKKAVALNAKSSKCFGGIAKCYLALGELSGAERAITKASDAGYACTDDRRALETLHRLHAQAQKFIEEQNYERAISCMDQCLQLSPFSSRVKLIKAECLAMLGKIEQALEIADDCIRLNQSDVDALFVKGLCLYYNEKHDQALKYFKEVLRLSPDHRKATAAYKKTKLLQQKKEQGNEEFKKGRWQKALLLYNEALAVDQTHIKINAKLHFNKATVYRKLNQTQLAADSCTAALELDENYVKALTLRATCFTELEEYDCVIDDYEKLYRIEPSDDIKRLLDEAKQCQDNKSLRRNYYEILGLDRSATKPDIKRAYKQLSLMHHPDRHSGRSEFERKRQERRFKEVLEAYTVLSDPAQRRKYDARGHKAWKNDQR